MKLISVHCVLFDNIIQFSKNRRYSNKKGPKSFQILGFDVLIDKKGKAHCLEVNGAPSMSIDHDLPVSKQMQEYMKANPRYKSALKRDKI